MMGPTAQVGGGLIMLVSIVTMLIGVAIPIVTLIFVILIHKKVSKIEKK